MRVTGWFIDGFGIFQDHVVRDVPPGLTVFQGPNEAGKTTLLAFIRHTLFGYPGEHDRERRYEPLRGTRHGGRLFLTGSDGEWVIERTGEPRGGLLVTLPDETVGNEDDLHRLLGGADRKLFQTIFAFSLAELQDFATLDAEGIHDRIFSAGIMGAGKSAREAREQLEARQARLLRPRGGARIDDLIGELEELDRRLKEARHAASGYPEMLRRERACADDVERLAAAIEERRNAQARYRKLGEVWPVWCRRRDALRELATLEPVDSVPERAEPRFAELSQAIEVTAKQVDTLRRELLSIGAHWKAMVPDDRLATVAEETRQLGDTLPAYRERIVKLPEVEARRRQTHRRLTDALRDLGPDWNAERLSTFDRSIPRREEVRAHGDALAAASDTLSQAEAEVKRAEAQQARVTTQRDALRVEAAAIGLSAADQEVDLLDGAIRRLRATIAERGAVEARGQVAEKALEQLDTLHARAAAGPPPPSTRVKAGLWGLALVLTAGSVLLRHAVLSPLLAFIAVVVALIALSTGRNLFRSAGSDDPVRDSFAEQQARLTHDLEAFRVRLRELDAAMAADAATLGISAPPSAAEVEAAAARANSAGDARERRARLTRELEAAEREVRDHEAATTAALGVSAAASEELYLRLDAWETWKRGAGVPGDLTPQGVLDFFETVRLAREALRDAEIAEREYRQIAQFIRGFEQRAAELLAVAGQTGEPRGLDLIAAIERLRERVEHDRALRRERQAIETEIGKRRQVLDAARHDLAELVGRRDALFAEAGVTDEPSFRHRLNVYQRRQELLEVKRECDQRIAEQVGGGAQARQFIAELGSGAVERWERATEDAGREMIALTDERDRAIAARRDAETARRGLEESTLIPDLELERAGLLQALDDAVREWRAASLAEGLIAETLARFERERQPEVLAHASRLFSSVTAEEYTRLLQRESGLTVIDRHGRSRLPETLSRGTAEQLYLCIRLGLAAEYARRAAVLPLVMDDVLVNFDPERARAVAEVLCGFADDRQVLLFTCHPETAELIKSACPESGHYVMSRYGGPVRAASESAGTRTDAPAW